MNVNHIYLQTKHAKDFYLKYGYNESKVIPTIKIDKKVKYNQTIFTNLLYIKIYILICNIIYC